MNKFVQLVGTFTNGVKAEDNGAFLAPIAHINGTREPVTLVSDRKVLCELDTSYNGELLDRWTVWRTPFGLVQRHKWQRGAGLERGGVDWTLIPEERVRDAQALALATSRAADAATDSLRQLVGD